VKAYFTCAATAR